jgi:glycerophosphoryl diester phosphodiesterase
MVQVIGHRGAAGEAPENTLEAFAHARGLGLSGVELDVHLSADGLLVVIHDDTLDRTTPGHGPVADLTAAQLSALGVPRLSEMLEQFPGFATYQIEIKAHDPALYAGLCRQLAETVERAGLAEHVLVISFDAAALAAMRTAAPNLARGLLGGFAELAEVETAAGLGCAWISVYVQSAAPGVLEAARERGLRVSCWTCNSAEEVRRAVELEAEAVVTDVPTLARTVLSGA